MQEDISLRSLRLGKRTVMSSLSPYHGRTVWNCGREHRIATGEGASAFLSPFGMTSMWRRGRRRPRGFWIVWAPRRCDSVSQHRKESARSAVGAGVSLPPDDGTVGEFQAKGVLPPEYVAGGGRHSGLIPVTRESSIRPACKVVARFRLGKTERKKSARLFMLHDQTDNPCATSRRVLRVVVTPCPAQRDR